MNKFPIEVSVEDKQYLESKLRWIYKNRQTG
jgi:hypothetical protein